MKASVFIATSLDGFIARKNGDIDWLISADSKDNHEDYGYKEFSDSIDCLVMGRKCLETALKFTEWPYEGKRVVVLSNTMTETPEQVSGKVELYYGSLKALIEKLDSEQCNHLYIDGGKTIQSFLREGIITDLTITKIPILLGEGLTLFGELQNDLKLTHIKTESYTTGFVKSTYEVEQTNSATAKSRAAD